jgi:hypothetical protein
MNILTLSIKQKFFDAILNGDKKNEIREIRPNNFNRYCRYLHRDVEYMQADSIPDDDSPVDVIPVKYDALKLLTGSYKDKRPYIVVKVLDAQVFFLTDEKDEQIVYEVDGKEYLAAEIEYNLGKIIEKQLYE